MTIGPVPAVRVQEKDDVKPPKIRFKYEQAEKFSGNNIVELRPNSEQKIFLFVENENEVPLRKVVVKLSKVEDGGAIGEPLGTSVEIPIIDKKTSAPVTFAPPKPAPAPQPPAGEKKQEVKAGPPPGIELPGPPFELHVEISYKDATTSVKKILPVRIHHPKDYVTVTDQKFDRATQTVSFQVARLAPIYGAFCQVYLRLLPENILGLVPAKVEGNYKAVLPSEAMASFKDGEKNSVELLVKDLKFPSGPPDYGRFYVTVDGYDRAFMYWNAFNEGKLRELEQSPRIRIFAPRFAVPGPKTPVRLEVDYPFRLPEKERYEASQPRPKPLLVELDLDLDGTGKTYAPLKVLRGPREEHVFVELAGGGALVFRNTSQDWAVAVDTSEVYGTRNLRARLRQSFVKDTYAPEYHDVFLFPEQDKVEQKVPVLDPAFKASPYAGLTYEESGEDKYNAVMAAITFDATPPEIVSLAQNLEDKKTHIRGAPIKIWATVQDQPPNSTIKQVIFFVGKLTPKGEIPPDALKVEGFNLPEGSRNWFAQIPIPTDKPGRFEIGAQATNGAGLSTAKVIILELRDPPAAGKAGVVAGAGAKILGRVVVGGRPQQGVGVALADPKGEIKGFTKTNKLGAFEFVEVAPGTYNVAAANPALKLKGATLVTVPPGVAEVTGVSVEMKR
jgi:hypothetical protein